MAKSESEGVEKVKEDYILYLESEEMTPKEFFNLRYYKENLVGKKILLDGTMRTLQKIYDTFMEYRNAS